MKVIKAKNITKKNFSKFGQLIDASKKNPINIAVTETAIVIKVA